MHNPVRLGLVGLGKIARDQHLPTISHMPEFRLVAVASPGAQANGVQVYERVEDMLQQETDLDAVVLCQPPQFRFEAAKAALQAGRHVFMEKPPGKTVAEVLALARLADQRGLSLFTSWHSRGAPAVARSKALLAGAKIRRVTISWKEDVRVWHPGQSWLWSPGGLGVFDPGVNALSILTWILEEPVHVVSARFATPENSASPIAAEVGLETQSGAPVDVTLDFRVESADEWTIEATTDAFRLKLGQGGKTLTLDGAAQRLPPQQEYHTLYVRFLDLLRTRSSDVDVRPLQLAADAFLVAQTAHLPPWTE